MNKMLKVIIFFLQVIFLFLYFIISRLLSGLSFIIRFPIIVVRFFSNVIRVVDIKICEIAVKFIGFVTPRSSAITLLICTFSKYATGVLQSLLYVFYIFFRFPVLFYSILKLFIYVIFVTPIIYFANVLTILYYKIVRLFYFISFSLIRIVKYFLKFIEIVLELAFTFIDFYNTVEKYRNDRKFNSLVRAFLQDIFRRFKAQQAGSISLDKTNQAFYHTDIFALDKYFLTDFPIVDVAEGRQPHEHDLFESSSMARAHFFFQSSKKYKAFSIPYYPEFINRGRSFKGVSIPGSDVPFLLYDMSKVFDSYKLISGGAGSSFNFSMLQPNQKLMLFRLIMQFKVYANIKFYSSIFHSTVENMPLGASFWKYYSRAFTSLPSYYPSWFESDRGEYSTDLLFSYNNKWFNSSKFSPRSSGRQFSAGANLSRRHLSGSRWTFDSHTFSGLDNSFFSGFHASQFADDYDYYSVPRSYYKSSLDRFWFKRLLTANILKSIELMDGKVVPVQGPMTSYSKQLNVVFKSLKMSMIYAIPSLLGIVLELLRQLKINLNSLFGFIIRLLRNIGSSAVDYIFFSFLSAFRFYSYLSSSSTKIRNKIFFSYPIMVSLDSIFLSIYFIMVSMYMSLRSLCLFGLCLIEFISYKLWLPVDFIYFIKECYKKGNLAILVHNEALYRFKCILGTLPFSKNKK